MFTEKYGLKELRRFPVEVLLAAGVILGILSVSRSWFFAAAALLFFLFPKRNTAAAFLFFILGGTSAFFLLPRTASESVYGAAKLRITDMRLSQAEGLTAPSLIAAEILEFAPHGETAKPHREKTFLRLPYGSSVKLHPGELCQAEGLLAAPPASGFANYLYARKVKRTFQLDRITRETPPSGWRHSLAVLRDMLLEQTLAGIEDPETRGRIAGLFFNAGGGLSHESREQFLRSGTIHIFSVSGMHVAMLAALLLVCLRFIPGMWREGCVLAVLVCYVISTGANAPALRALGMIGCFLVLRMVLLQTPPLRILSLIAAVLLSFSPGLLFDIGFLYSFVITAVLLSGMGSLRESGRLLRAVSVFTQTTQDRLRILNRSKPIVWVLSALSVSLLSFWGGLAISVCSRGLLLPGSVAANILLLPLVPLLFFFLGFKLLLGWLPGVGTAGAFLLKSGFFLLDAVTGVCSDVLSSLPVIRPPLGEAVLFYAMFAVFLTVKRHIYRSGALVLSFLLVGSWVLRPQFEPPFTAVFTADAETPVMVVEAVPAEHRAAVYDAPSADMSYLAAELLVNKGITEIEFLRFSQPKRDFSRGAKALASQLPVTRLELPGKSRKTFLNALKKDFPPEKLQTYSVCRSRVSAEPGDCGWQITVNGKRYFQTASRQVQVLVIPER